MGKNLVIFDLDGTLLNTISDLGRACNYALGQLGLPQHEIVEYNKMVGNGLRKLVERAAPDQSKETIDRLIEITRGFYNVHCTDTTRPYPGIPELLEELTQRGVSIAVASNKYQEGTELIIRHFFPEVPFITIQGQIDTRPVKPDPSIIFDIIDLAQIPKQDVAFVGDSLVDIKTAKRAGVTGIAVTWGFSPSSELETARPDHLVSSASEILKYI